MPSELKSRFQSNWRGLFAPTLLGLRNPNRYYLSGWNGSIILLRRSQELSLQMKYIEYMEFEWEPSKAKSNLRKHAIPFDYAICFFLMIRRPPRFTLFTYTTLFR